MWRRTSWYVGTHVSEEYSASAFRIEHGDSTLLRIPTYHSTQRQITDSDLRKYKQNYVTYMWQVVSPPNNCHQRNTPCCQVPQTTTTFPPQTTAATPHHNYIYHFTAATSEQAKMRARDFMLHYFTRCWLKTAVFLQMKDKTEQYNRFLLWNLSAPSL